MFFLPMEYIQNIHYFKSTYIYTEYNKIKLVQAMVEDHKIVINKIPASSCCFSAGWRTTETMSHGLTQTKGKP